MNKLWDSLALHAPKYEWEVEDCINKLYSKDFTSLEVTLTEFDTSDESKKPLINCLGYPITLDGRPALLGAAKWAMSKLSEGFYRHKLGHCDLDCFCNRPEYRKHITLGFWEQFDIIRIEGYYGTALAVKEAYESKQINEQKTPSTTEAIIRKYLEDQLIVDYTHETNGGYKRIYAESAKFRFGKDEFSTLCKIAQYRYENNQPLGDKLQAFLVYNAGEKNRVPGQPLPTISKKIDYRIVYMLKTIAEDKGIDFKDLIKNSKKHEETYDDELCAKINEWRYFQTVGRTASGLESGGDSAISSVIRRYLAKHPM